MSTEGFVPGIEQVSDGSSAPISQPEYRPISAFFIDIVGSVNKMAEHGSEEYADILQDFHSMTNDVVRRNNGFVAQYLGDGAMCFFGYPVAHENDATNAINAGLELLELQENLQAKSQTSYETRIGISSGTALFQLGQDIFGANAVGQCINLAARLQSYTKPGTILVCEDTQRLAGSMFRLEADKNIGLKGFEDPITAYTIKRSLKSVGPTRFDRWSGSNKVPLAGRQKELSILESRLEQAGKGNGNVVFVSGQAGIGKSRIVHEFLNGETTEGCARVVLQCDPNHTNTQLHPVRNYLEWLSGTNPSETSLERHTKIERLFSSVWGASDEELAELLYILSPVGGEIPKDPTDAKRQRDKVFDLLKARVIGVGEGRKALVLLVEDLHWIDPSSQELIANIVTKGKETNVLFIITSREGPEGVPFLGNDYEHIELTPINSKAAEELASNSLNEDVRSQESIEWVVKKSEGVPLFTEAYADILNERGNNSDDLSSVPLNLRGIVQNKLDRLDAGSKSLARMGSILGRRFDPKIAGKILGQSVSETQASVNALLNQKFLEADGLDDRMSFTHALIQDAIYESLRKKERLGMHGSIADKILSAGEPYGVGKHIIASHLQKANRFPEAINLMCAATFDAATSGAMLEAMGHLESAFGMVENIPSGKERDGVLLQLLSIKGPLTMVMRGPGSPDFGAIQSQSMELLDQLGNVNEMPQVLFNSGLHSWATAQFSETSTLVENICQVEQETGEDGAFMAARTLEGLIAWHQGKNELALKALTETANRHDMDTHRPLFGVFQMEFGVFSHFYKALTNTVLGLYEEGRKDAKRSDELGKQSGFQHPRCFGLLAQFNVAMLQGRIENADKHSASAIEIAIRQGFPEFEAMGRFTQGWVKARKGYQEAGIQEMTGGLEFWAATGFTCWQAMFAAILADDLILADKLDQASNLLAKYEELLEQTQERQFLSPILLAKANLYASKGDTTFAKKLASNARSVAESQGAKLWLDRIFVSFPDMKN